METPPAEKRSERLRLPESVKSVMRWNAAVFAALALHVGGLNLALEKDQIGERAQSVLTDLKDEKDKVIDFFNPGNVDLVVKSLERGTESKEKIDNLENFYIVADKLKNNFTPEQVAAAQQNMDAEIATAEQMKTGGADQRKVVDYILSQQGKYNETQNSLIAMMDVPLAQREGNCNAWFLDMSAVLAAVYTEDYATGRIKAETFDGADLDGDGKPDTVAHIRTVITQPDGKILIAEGKKSYIDNPDPEAPKPTTEEVSTIVTRSFLASNDLYTHLEGPTLGKHIDGQYKSFLDMPGSPATYAGGLVMSQPVSVEKPAEKIPPAKPKPVEVPPVSERPEEFKVTLLEDPVVPKVLTLADLQDPNFDVKQFNDIDPQLIQYAFDHCFTLTQEPSLEVAQELGKAHPAVLTLDFIPSREILTALAPIERIEIRNPITNAEQIAPLVDWLSVDSKVDDKYTDEHELTIRGAIPEELQKALKQRFGHQVYVVH